MKTLARWIVFCVCAAAMLSIAGAQTAPTDFSGRWSGSFDVVQPSGSVQPDTSIFMLKQDGKALTGTAGQSEARQSPIANGEIVGNHAHFDLIVNPQMTVHFDLAIDGDHLRGAATGMPAPPGSKVVVDARRWPQGAPAPTIAHTSDNLFATVAALDTKFFDAYNHCDLATLSAMVSDGLEFYHDQTGLTVGKQPFLDAIKSNICGHTQRTLVQGSLQVYPLKGYGAVEIGVHRFHHPTEPGLGVGEGKFITLWEYKDGTWKISRAISYDHENVKQ